MLKYGIKWFLYVDRSWLIVDHPGEAQFLVVIFSLYAFVISCYLVDGRS